MANLKDGSSAEEMDAALLELEADLRDRLKIDPMALEHEFIRCPSDIAYLAAKHARAIGDDLRSEAKRKKLWGLLLIQAREDLDAANDSAQRLADATAAKEGHKPKDAKIRITESMVEAQAQQLSAWREATENEIDSKVAREIARGNLLAVLAKKDMLVQMGANARAEMERDPSIRNDRRASRGSEG